MMAENDLEKMEPETVAATEPSSTATADAGGGPKNPFHVPHVEAQQVPLVGYAFASFIFMISALAQRPGLGHWYGYAVSVGVLGIFFAGMCLVLLKYRSEVNQTFLAYFLLVWSLVGACLLTFGSTPFNITGNGYFSIWAMVIFAVQHCGVNQEHIKDGIGAASSTTGLGIASVVLIAAISVAVKNGSFVGASIYALTLACITVVLVGSLLYLELKTEIGVDRAIEFYVLSVFAIMWIVMACLVTFDGPFTFTGNGYFASWAGAVLSVFAALGARQKLKAGM